MASLDKYNILLDTAEALIIEGLQCTEQDGVLILRGIAPNAEVKNKLWDIYNQIDPNYISGEVMLNITVSPTLKGCRARLVTDEPNLNVRIGPGVELPIIGHVGKDEVISLVGRAHEYWWLIRTDNCEGYCYAQNIDFL